MRADWQPVREPLAQTLLRTVAIAVVVGGVVAGASAAWSRWPLFSLLALWFSLGGHYVEVAFLNLLRPRLPPARPPQLAARLATWWLGGTALAFGMSITLLTLTSRSSLWPTWYAGGLAFVLLELVVHLVLQLRGRPNFYDGQG